MFKKLEYEKECRYPYKLIIFVFLDILVSIMLYYVIELSATCISLKRVMISLLIAFAVLFAMSLTFKFERETSCIDPLTGVYNRRKLYIDMNKLIKNKSKFELVFIDLNNFKEVNDLYGHEAGDKILQNFGVKASKLGNNVTCYRTGGDEFILLSNNEKSIESIQEFNCLCEFNFSYGISRFLEDVIGLESTEVIIDKILTNADKKMYKRKRESKEG